MSDQTENIDPNDMLLARAGLEKRAKGEAANQREALAIRRVEKAREEKLRWEYYRTIPQGHYIIMSGRQAKILIEQSARYGIPFDGGNRGVVDLPAVIKGFHDFLADNAMQLAANKRDGVDGSTVVQLKEVKLRLALLEEAAEIGRLVPFERVQASYMAIANGIGRAIGVQRQTLSEEALRPLVEELAFQEDQWKRAWQANQSLLAGDAERLADCKRKLVEAEARALALAL